MSQPANDAIDFARRLGLVSARARTNRGSSAGDGAKIRLAPPSMRMRTRRFGVAFAAKWLGDAPADRVVLPGVHQHVDAASGRIDHLFEYGQCRSAVAVQLHRSRLQARLHQGRIGSVRHRDRAAAARRANACRCVCRKCRGRRSRTTPPDRPTRCGRSAADDSRFRRWYRTKSAERARNRDWCSPSLACSRTAAPAESDSRSAAPAGTPSRKRQPQHGEPRDCSGKLSWSESCSEKMPNPFGVHISKGIGCSGEGRQRKRSSRQANGIDSADCADCSRFQAPPGSER